MGFNSTVLILNDRLHEIAEDPEFGKRISDGITSLNYDPQKEYITGQTSVIETHHADNTAVIAVGGNHATVLGYTYGTLSHHKEEDQIEILKQLAEKYGYSLRKKPKNLTVQK
jgi:hypothetical protein